MKQLIRNGFALLIVLVLTSPWTWGRNSPVLAAFSDVAGEPAAIQQAIDYCTSRGYLEGYPDSTFKPRNSLSRIDASRALVLVFGHGEEQQDPAIQFTDLPASDGRFRWANLAVKHGLMDRFADGSFRPDQEVTFERVAISITHGLGLDYTAANIQRINLQAPSFSGSMVIFLDLHLKYYERGYAARVKIWPGGGYPRGDMAYTLQRIENLESWRKDYLTSTFTSQRCQPPAANSGQQAALNYGFQRLGAPYLYGGESEAEGGFDCSGFVYNTLSMRMGYPMKRVADEQARDERYLFITRDGLKPGDAIFFYEQEGGGSTGYIGHAGMYVGNGIFIHSTGSNGGVSLDCLDTSSYWNTHFAWGRRIVGGPYPDRFDEYLLLFNPGDNPAQVQVEFLRNQEPPFAKTYQVAPHSRYTISVDSILSYDEVSLKVYSDTEIVAERAMYFNYMGKIPGGHASIGTPSPSLGWFLAEGYTGKGFDTWLLLANPYDRTAQVEVDFLLESGECITLPVEIRPHSRHTIMVNDWVPPQGVSMRVRSTNGVSIFAERAMYFNYYGKRGGHASAAVSSLSRNWYFAEGYTGGQFDTYLLLGNPTTETVEATCSFYREDGRVIEKHYLIAPLSRLTIGTDGIPGLESASFSIMVTCPHPIMAERAVYFLYRGWDGGTDSTGVTSPQKEWLFAEGYTGG